MFNEFTRIGLPVLALVLLGIAGSGQPAFAEALEESVAIQGGEAPLMLEVGYDWKLPETPPLETWVIGVSNAALVSPAPVLASPEFKQKEFTDFTSMYADSRVSKGGRASGVLLSKTDSTVVVAMCLLGFFLGAGCIIYGMMAMETSGSE